MTITKVALTGLGLAAAGFYGYCKMEGIDPKAMLPKAKTMAVGMMETLRSAAFSGETGSQQVNDDYKEGYREGFTKGYDKGFEDGSARASGQIKGLAPSVTPDEPDPNNESPTGEVTTARVAAPAAAPSSNPGQAAKRAAVAPMNPFYAESETANVSPARAGGLVGKSDLSETVSVSLRGSLECWGDPGAALAFRARLDEDSDSPSKSSSSGGGSSRTRTVSRSSNSGCRT